MFKIERASDVRGAYDAALEMLRAAGGMHCALMSAFEKRGDSCFVVPAANNAASGVFTFDGHTLNVFFRDAGEMTISLMKRFLADKNIFCLVGDEQSAALALEALRESRAENDSPAAFGSKGAPAVYVRNMVFMEAASEDWSFVPEGFTFKMCGPEDADSLFPLQLAYTKEEVSPPGHKINPAAVRLKLERALKRGVTVCALNADGAVCAKGGETDSCERFFQIGGMYTVPAERGKGLARALAGRLALEAQKRALRAVLYVDEKNAAARAAYRRAGFEACGRYRIVYCAESAQKVCGNAPSVTSGALPAL